MNISTIFFQIRIDFNTFNIAGPSTDETAGIQEVNGGVALAGPAVSFATRCLTDTFSITGGGASNPPVICGTNTGQHGIFLKLVEFFAYCSSMTISIDC